MRVDSHRKQRKCRALADPFITAAINDPRAFTLKSGGRTVNGVTARDSERVAGFSGMLNGSRYRRRIGAELSTSVM
jgi:hypothetical protein